MPTMATGCKGSGCPSENEVGTASPAVGLLADGATEPAGVGIPDAVFVAVLELASSKPDSTLIGGPTREWVVVAGNESPMGMMKDMLAVANVCVAPQRSRIEL